MKTKNKQVNIALSEKDYEKLKNQAKKEKRNLTQYIRLLLDCEDV
jgi:predicted DNA binding CopG/RHH family protein